MHTHTHTHTPNTHQTPTHLSPPPRLQAVPSAAWSRRCSRAHASRHRWAARRLHTRRHQTPTHLSPPPRLQAVPSAAWSRSCNPRPALPVTHPHPQSSCPRLHSCAGWGEDEHRAARCLHPTTASARQCSDPPRRAGQARRRAPRGGVPAGPQLPGRLRCAGEHVGEGCGCCQVWRGWAKSSKGGAQLRGGYPACSSLHALIHAQVLRAAQRSAGPGAVRDDNGRVVKGGCRIVVGIG